MKDIIRIGDFGLRRIENKNSLYTYEIVQYFPNERYGKQEEYYAEKDEMGEIQWYKPNADSCIHISVDSFNMEEWCYVVGWFICTSEEPDFKTVGSRPFILNEDNTNDFLEVVRWFYKNWSKGRKLGNKIEE